MVDVKVFNNSGSANRKAKLMLASGTIRFEDGSYSHISGESARGCRVEEIPEVKPVEEVVKKKEEAPSSPTEPSGKAKKKK